MRRKSLLAALLLPLPFTALPVVAVLLGGTGSAGQRDLAINPVPVQQQADEAALNSHPLAYGISESPLNACPGESPSPIEG